MADMALLVQPRNSNRTLVQFPETRSILSDLDAITNEIAQRAVGFFSTRGTDGRDLEDWFRAESELLIPVPVELSESDSSFNIKAEVPGFTTKELSVRAEGNSVIIEGKKEEKKEQKDGKQVTYSEVSARKLFRRIDLPSGLNPEGVAAQLTNGILELTIPKAVAPKAIEVKAA